MTALLLMLATAAVATALLFLWPRAVADLVWMAAIRPAITGLTTIALLLFVVSLIHLLFGLDYASPTAVMAGLLLVPLAARQCADQAAYFYEWAWRLRDGAELAGALPPPRKFIFTKHRQDQKDAYEAPSVSPDD